MTVEPSSDTRRVSRAGYGLSAAAAAATLLFFAPSNDAVRFVKVSLPVVAVLLVLALVGLLGARTGRSVLFLLAGLGIGFCALWYAARESQVPAPAVSADPA
ncbi:MAG: hypothetical protein M3446_00690 [Actinomycetota bacterium]|nr:hypothetical protein [Actinomycetota bacterium]